MGLVPSITERKKDDYHHERYFNIHTRQPRHVAGWPVGRVERMTDLEARIEKALAIATSYGGTDGDHHKAWVIDQMCRALLQDRYAGHVAEACMGEDGPNTYGWDEGIAP